METGTYVATYVTVSTETGTYVGTRLRGDGHIRRYPSPRRRSHTYVFVSKRMPVQSVGSDCLVLIEDKTTLILPQFN